MTRLKMRRAATVVTVGLLAAVGLPHAATWAQEAPTPTTVGEDGSEIVVVDDLGHDAEVFTGDEGSADDDAGPDERGPEQHRAASRSLDEPGERGSRAAGPPADEDVMPDGPLKHCVTRTWDPATRPATFANTKTVTSANINSQCIAEASTATVDDWTGAEFLPGVITLSITAIGNVVVPDAGGLGALFPQLRTLNITNGGTSTVPALGTMPELTTLNLTGNALTAVSGLTGLPKLATLTLTNNALTTLSALSGVPSLVTITATNNQLTTFPALGTLPALATLTLTGNQITAVTNPTGLPGLVTLTLTNNAITTISGFDALVSLRTLTLTGNQITDLSDLGRLPDLTHLTLNTNALTAVPTELDLPELTQLAMTGNAITVLAVPNRTKTPKLATLNVSSNQIAEVAAPFALVPGLTINAGSQTVTHPAEVSAVDAHPLDVLLAVPGDFPPVPWTPGADNMAAVNLDTGRFTAAQSGEWTLRWAVSLGANAAEGRLTYSGGVTGTAVGDDAIEVSFEAPGITREGDDAVYQATVEGLDPASFTYQWYRGTNASNATPVAGETGATFTVPAVTRSDNGAFVKVVVTADGGVFQTTAAQLAVQPALVDPGLAACLDAVYGGPYSMADLSSIESLDCSSRGITSLVDLPLIRTSAPIDLSRNMITDLSPLVRDTGALLRTARTDLSHNLISDVTPLGIATVSFRTAVIVLDGNRISDVSPLADTGNGPRLADTVTVSIRGQRIGLAPVAVEVDLTLPQASGVVGGAAPLHLDDTLVPGPTVQFPTAGLRELTWDIPVSADTKGVHFGGAFVVPVGLTTSVQLTPGTPTGGHPVDLQAVGFVPGELVTFAWEDGTTVLVARADDGGMVAWSFLVPYAGGEKELTAVGESGRRASVAVTIADDEVVDLPDDALRACVNAALFLPPDAITYRTRVARITGGFTCRDRGVSDLTGLDQIPATSIDLIGNALTSLDTLATLHPATTSLDLRKNVIDRLGEVAPQPGLWTLDLSQNRLTDVTALNAGGFGPDTTIDAYGQTAAFPVQLLGIPGPVPVIPVADEVVADLYYPEGITPDGGTILWPEEGDFSIGFNRFQAADAAAEPPRPELNLTGTLEVLVVDRGEPQVLVNPETVYPTQMVNILATGFTPGERAVVSLHSDPLLLGTPTVDHLGMVRLDEVVIPRNTAAGAHTLRVEGTLSGTIRSTELTVLDYPTVEVVEEPSDPDPTPPPGAGDTPGSGANPVPPSGTGSTGGVPGGGGGALARTGLGGLGGLVVLALVALALGGGLVATGRGRRAGGRSRWRLLATSGVMALLVGATGVAPASAQAADIEWRHGWCYEDEGMTLVMNIRKVDRERWPPGNHLGHDIRCLTGPGVRAMPDVLTGMPSLAIPPLAGIPTQMNGNLYGYWGIGNPNEGFIGAAHSVAGWGTQPGPGNINRFISVSHQSSGQPAVVPQFLPRGTGPGGGGGGGGRPDMNPTPGSPGNPGPPKADVIVVPGQPQTPPSPPPPPPPGGGSPGGEQPGGGNPSGPGASGGGSGRPGTTPGTPGGRSGAPSTGADDGDGTTTTTTEADVDEDADPDDDATGAPTETGDGEDDDDAADQDAAGRVFAEETPGAPAPATTSRRTWPWIVLGTIVVAAALAGGGLLIRARGRTGPGQPPGAGAAGT